MTARLSRKQQHDDVDVDCNAFVDDMRIVRFTVYGVAAPQGSKTLGRTRGGRTFVRESSRAVGPWRESVRQKAWEANDRETLLRGPVRVRAVFTLPRPKGHFTSKGALRLSAPPYPVVKPDLDKLARAVLDGLQDVLIASDAQVVDLFCLKRYGEPARCDVTVTELEHADRVAAQEGAA